MEEQNPQLTTSSSLVYLSNLKPGHITGGSGRGARRSGRARSSKIGCQQNYSPRKERSPVRSKASKKRRFNDSPEARTSKMLCKPTEEQNQQLTTGLSAGREALFVPGCRPVERRLFFSVNPFHARHVREPVESKTRTYHGRVEALGGTAERPGGIGQDCVPTELFAQETQVPCTLQGIAETALERFSRSTNKRNPM